MHRICSVGFVKALLKANVVVSSGAFLQISELSD